MLNVVFWNVMCYPCMIEKEQARWSWSPSWRCRKGSGNTTEGRRWSRLSFLSKISLQLDHFARLGGTTIPKIPRKVKQDLEVALNTGSHRHVWNATYLWSSLDRDQSTSENRSACNRCRRLAIWIWVSERSEQICIDYIHLYSFINCTHSTQQPLFEDVGHASGFVVAVLFSFIVLPWPLTRSRSFHVGLGLWLGPGLSSPS